MDEEKIEEKMKISQDSTGREDKKKSGTRQKQAKETTAAWR